MVISQNLENRYAAQQQLSGVAESGQVRIRRASVLIVGAGGLGSPLAAYLVGAGVGQLAIVDHDRVTLSNLQRQIVYREADIGKLKAQVLAGYLQQQNNEVTVAAYCEQLSSANVAKLVRDYDVIIDAADNFATTYLLSDICFAQSKPLVSASVAAKMGYLALFCDKLPSYRALFPQPPASALSCTETGVSGPAVGAVAMLQAQLVLDYLLDPVRARATGLLQIDLDQWRLSRVQFINAPEPIDPLQFDLLAASDVVAEDILVDVRSAAERAQRPLTGILRTQTTVVVGHESLPVEIEVACSSRWVFCCTSGRRALKTLFKLGVKELAGARLAVCAIGA